MAGRHEVGSDLFAVGPQLAELEPDVADHARIGRSSREILVREVILDPREVALEIEGVKRDVEAIGDTLRIERVGHAAAGLGTALGIFGRGPGAHEDADHVVALLLQAARRRPSCRPRRSSPGRLVCPWSFNLQGVRDCRQTDSNPAPGAMLHCRRNLHHQGSHRSSIEPYEPSGCRRPGLLSR